MILTLTEDCNQDRQCHIDQNEMKVKLQSLLCFVVDPKIIQNWSS